MTRLLALWQKEWLALSRDILGLAVLFVMAAAFIVVMSLALSDVFREGGGRGAEFALAAARMIRGRDPLAPPALAERLRALAAEEKRFFRDLDDAKRAWA